MDGSDMRADRLAVVAPSMIMGLVAKARALKAQGHPIIDLGIGEPDFKTPDHVKAAAIKAIHNDETRYTVVAGTPALRSSISDKLKRDNALDYTPEEITVSGGAKQVIYNAFMASLSKGDLVIVPAPYWSSYPDMVAIADGTPIIVDCPQEDGFLMTPDRLEKAITPKTKWLMLNSPSNPTGGAYSKAQLAAIAEVLRAHPHVWVLSDDIYEHLMFDDHRFVSILNAAPDLKPRTLLVNGVSKVFAMTGWRIGYGAGPASLIAAMNAVQGQSSTHACSISQAASVAALEGPADFFADRAASFQRRRDIVVDALSAIDGVSCLRPEGAFYVFPRIEGLIGQTTPDGVILTDDTAVSTWLLERHHLSTVPGTAFGLSPHIRISTAASEDDLRSACARIRAAVGSLRAAA
ncbi:pyridoxal phosphate-dependent aminotransferase [uncultured Roseovarius sp.]|uniref:pyridoxal phosphate-dependent aminotransferase n=1 Tax=uncultured Roseovarius sp. TaxID=293344 RepID=UPI00261520C7|nr:pyridoxal phosphate-dependent aminotransferase [uncultured Roseovarius sp.]